MSNLNLRELDTSWTCGLCAEVNLELVIKSAVIINEECMNNVLISPNRGAVAYVLIRHS